MKFIFYARCANVLPLLAPMILGKRLSDYVSESIVK